MVLSFLFSTLCPSFCNHVYEETATCLAMFVFLMAYDSQCSVTFLMVQWVCMQCMVVAFPDSDFLLLGNVGRIKFYQISSELLIAC